MLLNKLEYYKYHVSSARVFVYNYTKIVILSSVTGNIENDSTHVSYRPTQT